MPVPPQTLHKVTVAHTISVKIISVRLCVYVCVCVVWRISPSLRYAKQWFWFGFFGWFRIHHTTSHSSQSVGCHHIHQVNDRTACTHTDASHGHILHVFAITHVTKEPENEQQRQRSDRRASIGECALCNQLIHLLYPYIPYNIVYSPFGERFVCFALLVSLDGIIFNKT